MNFVQFGIRTNSDSGFDILEFMNAITSLEGTIANFVKYPENNGFHIIAILSKENYDLFMSIDKPAWAPFQDLAARHETWQTWVGLYDSITAEFSVNVDALLQRGPNLINDALAKFGGGIVMETLTNGKIASYEVQFPNRATTEIFGFWISSLGLLTTINMSTSQELDSPAHTFGQEPEVGRGFTAVDSVGHYKEPTNFQRVAAMNEAFGNAKGDYAAIDFDRLTRQVNNVFDEFIEVQKALGLAQSWIEILKGWSNEIKSLLTTGQYIETRDLNGIRDGLGDINVFSYGAFHAMGVDGDRDMKEIVTKVMTRFIKNQDDLDASIAFHASRGVTDVYTEGEFPTMILKSGSDQPDAPKGKFLKAVSYGEPVFYDPLTVEELAADATEPATADADTTMRADSDDTYGAMQE